MCGNNWMIHGIMNSRDRSFCSTESYADGSSVKSYATNLFPLEIDSTCVCIAQHVPPPPPCVREACHLFPYIPPRDWHGKCDKSYPNWRRRPGIQLSLTHKSMYSLFPLCHILQSAVSHPCEWTSSHTSSMATTTTMPQSLWCSTKRWQPIQRIFPHIQP